MLFSYTAVNNQGEVSSGELETTDVRAVTDYLNRQELTVVSVKAKKNLGGDFGGFYLAGLSTQDKIMITKNLATIIKSGLSLNQGIETLLNDAKKRTLKKILTEARFNLEKGQPLSVTFKKYPHLFSTVFIALIEAGETSGTLDKSLDYLGIQLAKEYDLKQKIKAAMVYPAVLIAASIVVITILMVAVIPKLTTLFSQSNMELPWTTKAIMEISKFTTQNIFLMLVSLLGISTLFMYLKTKKYFQKISSNAILSIPLISSLYEKIILARFTRTLGTLLASGIGILKAFDISTEALGFNKYQSAIEKAKEDISRGVSIENALKKRKGIFPYLIINMVSVGEKTGKLDSVLEELANFYEKEAETSLKNIVSLIEPALLLVMGLVVAIIAFSVIMPIYQLVGTVS